MSLHSNTPLPASLQPSAVGLAASPEEIFDITDGMGSYMEIQGVGCRYSVYALDHFLGYLVTYSQIDGPPRAQEQRRPVSYFQTSSKKPEEAIAELSGLFEKACRYAMNVAFHEIRVEQG